MADSDTASGPLFSWEQGMWVLASLIWFVFGLSKLMTAEIFLGVIGLLVGGGAVYRAFRPK
jgi:hypothetical protein